MSTKRIIFERQDGSLVIRIPDSNARLAGESEVNFLNRVISKGKPAGTTQKAIIEASELPQADPNDSTVIEGYFLDTETQVVSKKTVSDKVRYFRLCWRWDGSKIIHDPSFETDARWEHIRNIRNMLLDLSDKDMAREAEQEGPNIAKLKTYRKKLRDLPEQANPKKITWPTKP